MNLTIFVIALSASFVLLAAIIFVAVLWTILTNRDRRYREQYSHFLEQRAKVLKDLHGPKEG